MTVVESIQKPRPCHLACNNEIITTKFLKLNAVRWDWRDAYHTLLTLSWLRFTGVLLALYAVLNVFFASLYWLGGADIDGMRPGFFPDAFFFSVETFATVGYGHMYPVSLYGHLVATLEIMSGMFSTALITGLIFVRFSRPTARTIFTRTMVVAPFDGQPTLVLRVANQRHQPMVEAEFRLMLFRNEYVPEELEEVRRFYHLPLQAERPIVFPSALTLRHTIDEESPLHGKTLETLQRSGARFMASVVCVDTVIPAPVQSQQGYCWRDLSFGERFVEIYADDGEGRIRVDYGRLHETEPAMAQAEPRPE